MKPPTDKQLAYLKVLGYVGTQPTTIGEATDLIQAIKEDGFTSADAERAVLIDRDLPIEKIRRYIAEAEQDKRNGNELAGWRLKVKRGTETSENSIYNGAFLPFDVGRKFPELLAISGLDFDPLQRRPAKGPVVVAPKQLSEITPGSRKSAPARPIPVPSSATPIPVPSTTPRKRGGCLGLLLMFAVLVCSLGLLSYVTATAGHASQPTLAPPWK